MISSQLAEYKSRHSDRRDRTGGFELDIRATGSLSLNPEENCAAPD